MNELKSNIEANNGKFDKNRKDLELDFSLIEGDVGGKYLVSESRRRLIPSPNSPFVFYQMRNVKGK